MEHSKTATITDRLYGEYENLLIQSNDGENNFYGKSDIIKAINEKFLGSWSGGQLDKGSGFWGGCPDKETLLGFVKELVKDKGKKTKEDKTI